MKIVHSQIGEDSYDACCGYVLCSIKFGNTECDKSYIAEQYGFEYNGCGTNSFYSVSGMCML